MIVKLNDLYRKDAGGRNPKSNLPTCRFRDNVTSECTIAVFWGVLHLACAPSACPMQAMKGTVRTIRELPPGLPCGL